MGIGPKEFTDWRKCMNMLARPIPDDLEAAMNAPDAINLGWARNFSQPDENSSWGYPGWKLLKQHCAATDVARVLNEYDGQSKTPPPPLTAENWDELQKQVKGRGYPSIIQGLMTLLMKATGKKVYIINVYMGDGAGVFEGIDVYCVAPDGKCTAFEV